jgi:hypothetical protein
MKLELKHVIPYLSYRLIVVDETNEPMDVEGVDLHMNQIIAERIGWNLDEVKPVLRNRSHVEEFNVELFKKFGGGFKSTTHFNQHFMISIKFKSYKELPYGVIDWLLEHHFDIYGLIEAGLAIDINTITNG